jgi:hypothetical protein
MFAARNMTLATSGFTPARLNPLFWFDFIVGGSYSGSGSVITDLGGAGYNGSTIASQTPYTTEDGGALTFNGGSLSFLNVSGIATQAKLSGLSKFTVAAFVKTTAGQRAVFSYGTSGAFTTDILLGIQTGKLLVQVNNGADGGAEVAYTVPSGYFHYALVFDGTQTGNANRLKVYINGVLQTLTFVGGYTVPATTGSPTGTRYTRVSSYGGSALGWYLIGRIAGIACYDKALSQADITSIFDYSKTRLGL